MGAAFCARDKDQNPHRHITRTYIHQARANDLLHQTAWRTIQHDTVNHTPILLNSGVCSDLARVSVTNLLQPKSS